MKNIKLFMTIMAICAFSMAAMATETARATVTFKCASGKTDNLKLYENSDYTNFFENGYDGTKIISQSLQSSVNVYGLLRDTIYATIMTDNLSGWNIEVLTNKKDTAYSFEFSNVSGRELKLVDKALGASVVISDLAVYEFTAEKDAKLADRFYIDLIPAGFQKVEAATQKARKMLVNGQLVIIRDDKVFTVAGTEK